MLMSSTFYKVRIIRFIESISQKCLNNLEMYNEVNHLEAIEMSKLPTLSLSVSLSLSEVYVFGYVLMSASCVGIKTTESNELKFGTELLLCLKLESTNWHRSQTFNILYLTFDNHLR